MDLSFRFATIDDIDLYFKWAIDDAVRRNSFNSSTILWESHLKWFSEKVQSKKTLLYLFTDKNNEPVGQGRIDMDINYGLIDFSVDKDHRGKSYGAKMLKVIANDFFERHQNIKLKGYVKIENVASQKCFLFAGFVEEADTFIDNIPCKLYTSIAKK